MALRPGDVRQTLDLTADDPRTLAYLKGEAISGSPELSGYVLVTVDGFSRLGQGFQGHCEESLSQGAPPSGVILKKAQIRRVDSMKEYKVVTAKNPEEAEQQMNIYAADGWVVKAVTLWETAMAYRLVITLERDSQATD